jgi:hypothetical protein
VSRKCNKDMYAIYVEIEAEDRLNDPIKEDEEDFIKDKLEGSGSTRKLNARGLDISERKKFS